jgi:TolA-binding protein
LRRTAILEGAAAALVVLAGFGAAWVTRAGDSAAARPGALVEAPPSPTRTPTPPPRTAVLPAPAPSTLGAAPASSPRPTTPAPLDEATLMVRLRSVKDGDPAGAIDLAREGNRRFPDSPDAPERTSIVVHALAGQGRASEARGEAEDMVNRYPDSSWVREVELFTGAHRHRNLRLTEAGTLESY